MSELVLRPGLWLLVCDGQKALLLRNVGGVASPKLETHKIFQQDNPLSHEQGSAPPGRVFASAGRRAATEESDFHRQGEEHFLGMVVDDINRRTATGEIGSLAMIAPARALGILRPLLSQHTQSIVTGDLARDYVKMPLHQIEQSLAAEQKA
jgi:protein required for attachment to host cells